MKRILLAIVGTVLGLVALLGFKSHPGVGGLNALPSAALPGAATTTPSTSSAAPPDPAATATSGSGSVPASSGPATAAPAPTSPAAAEKTIAGQPIVTRYGTIQVQIVVAGSRIQNVSFLQLTANDPRSQDINSQAAPLLLQETLTAQNANIDTISGATYTSEGYLQSLQSALDQAGVR